MSKAVDRSEMLRLLRQTVGREATRFTPGGRDKSRARPSPSLPKLKCLGELKDDGESGPGQMKDARTD
jgi:hypothetical protein